MGSERALAKVQKSPPGQAIMSVKRPMLARASPACRAACHKAGKSVACTHGSNRFCSWVTRTSPHEKASAKSAAASKVAALASPGAEPKRLKDKLTARSAGFWCCATLRCNQRSNSACSAGLSVLMFAADLIAAGARSMRAGGTNDAETRSNSACEMVCGAPSTVRICWYSSSTSAM